MKYVYKKKVYKMFFYIVDAFGGLIFGIVRAVFRRRSTNPKKILIIRIDHIGDVVMATSVLAPLQKVFPAAKIDFMAPSWSREILDNEPHMDNVVVFDPPWFMRCGEGIVNGIKGFFVMIGIISKGRYDVVVDLRGDARHIAAAFLSGVKTRIGYGITGLGFLLTDQVQYLENSHETSKNLALLKPLGVRLDHASPKLYFSKEAALEAENIKEKAGIDRPYAVLHVAAGRKEKNWTAEGFAGVIDRLAGAKGLVPVIIGSEADVLYTKDVMDKTSQNVIDLSGKVGLSAIGPLCDGASLFVGLDSGPSHIAASTGVPCVVLFSGVNDPAQWAPSGENVKVLYPGKGKSLDSFGVDEVISQIDKFLLT